MKRIFVLGHKGMLGHVVARFFREKGHEVITTDKRFEAGYDCEMFHEISASDPDVVINCIGKIKQKTEDVAELFLLNAILPVQLLQTLKSYQKLIHISSDCVFSGKKSSPYFSSDIPDPIDAYGASKAVGEIVALDKKAIVIRTSIIGPELDSSFGLFGWFVKNESHEILGYENHFWNGVTTLQLAKVIDDSLSSDHWLNPNITHAVSKNHVSKYELLCEINKIWQLEKQIKCIKTEECVNRTLEKNQSTFHYLFERCGPSIEQQLKELKEWY